MTRIALYFLLILLTFPCLSISAEMRTLEIGVSFNASNDPLKQHVGYRLFKDGEKVCDETVDANTSSIICNFLSENGTFNFTLKAYYSNNTESPSSPPFPFTLSSPAPTSNTNTEPPVAATYAWPLSGFAPLTVLFDGTSSTSENSSIASYTWTFGDNSPSVSGDPTTTHEFTLPGTYYSKLTVKNSEGLYDTITQKIVVSANTDSSEETTTTSSTPQTTEQVEIQKEYARRLAITFIISRLLTSKE